MIAWMGLQHQRPYLHENQAPRKGPEPRDVPATEAAYHLQATRHSLLAGRCGRNFDQSHQHLNVHALADMA